LPAADVRDTEQAEVFRQIAQQVAAQVSVLNARRPAPPKAPIKLLAQYDL
jgi:hypothetical protein